MQRRWSHWVNCSEGGGCVTENASPIILDIYHFNEHCRRIEEGLFAPITRLKLVSADSMNILQVVSLHTGQSIAIKRLFHLHRSKYQDSIYTE
jgi:hypothetical protein